MKISSGDYSGAVLTTPAPSDFPATFAALARDRIVSGPVTGESTEQDLLFDTYTEANVAHEFDISVESQSYPIVFEARTPSIATVSNRGSVTRVSNGTGLFHITTGKIKRAFSGAVSLSSGVVSKTFKGFVSGSGAKNAADTIDALLAGKVAAEAKAIYAVQNHGAGIYERSAQCWMAPLVSQMTGISPWNDYDANRRAGPPVSKRHVVYANHYPFIPGMKIRFITVWNEVIIRTVIAVAYAAGDVGVALLDEDLPASICFYKILPSTARNQLVYPQTSNAAHTPYWRVPALVLDQEEKALVADIAYITSAMEGVYFRYPIIGQRLNFSEELIGGDSGNPAFLIINNELVLLNLWTSGGAGAGTGITGDRVAINAVMASLDAAHGVTSGYQLTYADLSGFTNFAA